MTESTNPTPSSQSQAEKIKADLAAMLLKAAHASAKTSPPETAAPEQKASPSAQ